MSEVNGNVGIEMCVERNAESDICARFDRHFVGEKKLSYERIEFGIAVVKEGRNPFADRPRLVALKRADRERALNFGVNAGNGDVAVVVEQVYIPEHVAFALDVGCHFLHFLSVAYDFDRFDRVAADFEFERAESFAVFSFYGRADIDFRTADLLTCVVVDVKCDTDGFVVEFILYVCPSDLRPSSDVACVDSDELIKDVGQALCDLQLNVVGRKRCDNIERKRLSRSGVGLVVIFRSHCFRTLCAVDNDGRVFCEQCEDDLIEINVRSDLIQTEVARVDIERTARVIKSEQNFAFGSRLTADVA